jgi:hypothetical protein
MKRQFAWLIAAAFLGALAYHALDRWLLPSPAQAADRSVGNLAVDTGRQADGTLVITGEQSSVTVSPDGTVRVSSPRELIVGAADDVKIEGYRVKIDASSEVEIDAGSRYTLEASTIKIGDHNSDIKLNEGDDPICINDDGDITKSERIKAR